MLHLRIHWQSATARALVCLSAGVLWTGGCRDAARSGADAGGQETVGTSCRRDDDDESTSAADLTSGSTTGGYLCPLGDVDWYRFDVSDDRAVARLSVKMTSQLSPVSPTYAIWRLDGEGKTEEVAARPPGTAGRAGVARHCLSADTYGVEIRDRGEDDADRRHRYEVDLSLTSDADAGEPDDSRARARSLSEGSPGEGYVSCIGDTDWYELDVPDDQIVRLRLASKPATYRPEMTLRTAEGEVLAREVDRTETSSPTDIERRVLVSEGGTYFVRIRDVEGQQSDPETPYELSVEYLEDRDSNEPNGSPGVATETTGSPVRCGGQWQRVTRTSGTIGAPGDQDWFEVPVENCGDGIVEARAVLQTDDLSASEQWDLNEQLQTTLTLVRPHTKSSCRSDNDCRALDRSCDRNRECAGLFESCLSDGVCRGANVCLPAGVCGANKVQRRYRCSDHLERCRPGSGREPPPNRAVVSAPLSGASPVYLKVSDFQGDGAAPRRPYRLDIRVRSDPDEHEPSNVFTNSLLNTPPPAAHQKRATEIPVYDCTPAEGADASGADADGGDAGRDVAASDAGGGSKRCCANAAWTQGEIAYQNDLDWFVYQHPCPGEDCTLRFHYEVDAGPVDTLVNVFRGNSRWFTALSAKQKASQPARRGTTGGRSMKDRCYYAYQDHGGKSYGVLVRDRRQLYADDKTVVPASRDWSTGQTYRICIEKIADDCLEPPCREYQNGKCGAPP